MANLRSVRDGWIELPRLYSIAVQNTPIRPEDAQNFVTRMGETESGLKIAINIITKKLESESLPAFEFLESILDLMGLPEQRTQLGEFIKSLSCKYDILKIVRYKALGVETENPQFRARAIRFLNSAVDEKADLWFPASIEGPREEIIYAYNTLMILCPHDPTDVPQISTSTNDNSITVQAGNQCEKQDAETFHIENNGTDLNAIISNMWKTKDFADVMFHCIDGVVKAHRNIIGSSSQVFRAMFSNGLSESDTATVKIDDTNVETMNLALEFIYTRRINPTNQDAMISLIRAADKYQLDNLKNKCFDQLFVKSQVEEVGEMVALAQTYHASDQIKFKMQVYILRHKCELMKLPRFQKSVKDFPAEMAELILGTY